MNKFTDPDYLRGSQYKDPSNLDHRVDLHKRFSTNPKGWLVWVFDQLALPAGARILEAGCGPGLLWEHNTERLEGSWQVCLSDFSTGMVAEAKSRLHALGIHWYIALDAQALPFPDAKFDAVIANHMLYHVPDIDRVLCELSRVMQPGGMFFASTNGQYHLYEMAKFVSIAKSDDDEQTARAFNQSVRKFSLETGKEKLDKWFSDVDVRRYSDSLRVTDVEAIVRYVQSSSILRLAGPALGRLRDLLQEEKQGQGAISIRKDAGMLVGTKPNGA